MAKTMTDGAPAGSAPALPSAQWQAIGVTVRVVVTDADALEAARRILREEVEALDLACSRFRDDSELCKLNAELGTPVAVSALLAQAVDVALQAAKDTGGDVDPTLGGALVDLGYDRDFAALPTDGPAVKVTVRRAARWTQVTLDRDPETGSATVQLPEGVQLDLGATAKALGSDRAAARIHAELGCGVLVSLGGDIAVAGPLPEGGWAIRVQDRPTDVDAVPAGPTATVAIVGGGIATSSTAARRWVRGGEWMHHVIDPRTGMPAHSPWRTVTATAPTCVEANTATTAAIVRGDDAVAWLLGTGVPARLVAHDGTVRVLNGWPED